MDALKKAEKEKKEAAKKKTGQGPVLDTGEYSNLQDPSGQFSNTDSHEMPVNLDTSEISMELEPLSNTLAEKIPDASDSAELPMENTAEHKLQEQSSNQEQELGLENTDTGEVGFENTEEIQSVSLEMSSSLPVFDDTSETPTDNTVEEQTAFSSTLDDEVPFEETLDGVTASQLLQDIGQFDGQPTPVAASTVFAASRSSNVVSKFKVSLAVSLVLLVAAVVGLLIQYNTTPDVPNVPSPIVAKGVEAPRSPVLPDMLEPSVSVSSENQTTIQHPQETLPETETVYIQPSELTVSDPGNDWGPLYDEKKVEAMSVELTEVQSIASDNEVKKRSESITERRPSHPVEEISMVETTPNESVMAEEIVVAPVAANISPSMVKISRIKKPKPEVAINQQAYNAYEQGNYDVASSLYKTSLEKTPDNRDALLGLAAIQLRHDRPEAAYSLYQKVLKLNPKDSTARVALIRLQGNQNAGNNESLLKLLLKDQPESASTYFSLGNLYARQLRWPEAQLAFFEAYSRELNNADYAMNLAVSLDQLGQSKAALDYYNKAIDLSDKQSVSFNPSSILARIKTLSAKGS